MASTSIRLAEHVEHMQKEMDEVIGSFQNVIDSLDEVKHEERVFVADMIHLPNEWVRMLHF